MGQGDGYIDWHRAYVKLKMRFDETTKILEEQSKKMSVMRSSTELNKTIKITPLEIAQKYVYGEHDALTDNQEIIDMTKDIKQSISEQLLLQNVRQDRELLLAYEKYQSLKIIGKENKRVSKQMVDDFLANNCS